MEFENDAAEFCRTFGSRLPTDAEWEYACRAGTTAPRYGPLDDIAWHDTNGGPVSHPVGQKRANGFGVHDMIGNAWQWVADWSDAGEYARCADGVTDPTGPITGERRVVRGSAWGNPPRLCRAAFRTALLPSQCAVTGGFRDARSP